MSGTYNSPSTGESNAKRTGFATTLCSSRLHTISTRSEKVDVAIVGGGLCGLACAAALHKVHPNCRIKVYEQRPQPADLDDTSPGVGGGVRLEANGLKALTAISRRLAANVMAQGLYAQRVMLHDTDAGTLITHLHQQSPNQLHPSARQPALVVGWSELQQLLLDQLPPDTVQWDATAVNYSDSTSGGVTLHVVVKQPQQQGPEGEKPEDEASIQMQQQQQVDTAKDSPQQQQQQRRQYRHQKSAPSSATSPFLAASHQDAASLRSPSAPAAAGMNAAADSPPNDAADLTAHPLGQSLALVEEEAPPHAEAAEEEEQAAALQVERVTVHATLLVAADGPLSPIRQQLVGDGLPQFDNTLRWVGRLPGDLMSSIPGDFEAWWLGPGLAFNSHPLSNGDVAWEAQVSSSSLASAGYTWDPASHSLLPLRPVSRSSSPDSLRPHNSSRTDGSQTQQQEQQQQQQQGGASTATNGWTGLQTLLRVSTAAAGGSFDTARGAAAAPAGEGEPQARETGPVKPAAAAAAGSGQEGEAGAALHGMQAPTKPSQALLLQLFRAFPAPVRDMIAATPPASLLEAAVLTRPARALPNCLGRGGLVVLGEAAHPLRPSGQEISQAFEDAAELGAAVMACGVSRDALRRLEMRRRPRWRHIMQVSQALGACSNLGGVSLHQGLLDYTAQLHRVSFVPLRSMLPPKEPQHKRLLRWLGYGLLAWSAAAGVQALRKDNQGKRRDVVGPVAAVMATVGEAGEAAGKLMQDVTSAAAALPGGVMRAAKVGAKSEQGLKHGLGSAAAAVVDIAEEAAGKDDGSSSGDGLVRGWVPPKSDGNRRNPAARLRDAVIGRTMALGGVVSRPFTKFVRHKAVQTVADQLGAF